MENVTYLKQIWLVRYFWLHLAFADIRAKYRRSMLGLGWAFVQPMALTLLFTFVMGNFFKVPMGDYAPFIFSGLIFWELIVSTTINGCQTFIGAEGYIKQFTHPLLIYTLRNAIPNMINLLCAFAGLIIWVLCWKPSNFGFAWASLILSFPALFLFIWPIGAISAFIGIRFRDFSQLITIFMQAVYYVSPILFRPQMFESANMGFLLTYNPLYHLLNLFREPLLHGVWPSATDYLFVIAVSAILWLFVWQLIRRNENNIAFYF